MPALQACGNGGLEGTDYKWLMSCMIMGGHRGTWDGVRQAIGNPSLETLRKRQRNADLWNRGQMVKLAKDCNLTGYDILRIWFKDYLPKKGIGHYVLLSYLIEIFQDEYDNEDFIKALTDAIEQLKNKREQDKK